MEITVQNLIVDRDMVLKPSQQVWPWEVPILQEKYGESKVRLMSTVKIERDGLPNAGEEYIRLAHAHGSDGGSGGTKLTYVELAYGRGKAAITALDKAINDSTKKLRKPRKKTATKTKPVPEVVAEVKEAKSGGDDDPLGFSG
jgi:hypothetical protein